MQWSVHKSFIAYSFTVNFNYLLLRFDTNSQTTLSKIHTEDLLCSRHSEIVTPLKNNLKSIDHIVCTYTNETKAQKNKSGLFNQGFESQDQNHVLSLYHFINLPKLLFQAIFDNKGKYSFHLSIFTLCAQHELSPYISLNISCSFMHLCLSYILISLPIISTLPLTNSYSTSKT